MATTDNTTCTGCGGPRLSAILAVLAGQIACCPDCSTLTMAERNAMRAALADDTRRLNAIERFAMQNVGVPDDRDVVELRTYEDTDSEDEDGVLVTEWTVTGPAEWFGCRMGEGTTLRAAIDAALAQEAMPRAVRPSLDPPALTYADVLGGEG